MRVLIISHSVLNENTNMGKTLLAQFAGWDPQELAQLYVHSGVPHNKACGRYYSFSDVDAVKSVLLRTHHGRSYRAEGIEPDAGNADSALLEKVYVNARRRKLRTYVLRDLIWSCANWRGKHLRHWLNDFAPELIYLVPGDYGFTYALGHWVAKLLKIPMIVSCMDDYFIYNPFGTNLAGKAWKSLYMRKVNRAMGSAAYIQTICGSMAQEYEKLFQRPCFALYSSAEKQEIEPVQNPECISYVGNIGLGRAQQLCDMGKVLMSLDLPGAPKRIDVYSGEKRPELLALMTPENGINFHGAIPAAQVPEVYAKSIAAIHTESFEEDAVERVRYSVSTKIAELLSHGPCVLAYGPAQIASVSYLAQSKAAFVANSPEELKSVLIHMITDGDARAEVLRCARQAAAQNHTPQKNIGVLRAYMQRAVEEAE